MNCTSTGAHRSEQYKVVVLTKDGNRITGYHDGYGKVITEQEDVFELDYQKLLAKQPTQKLVLEKFYDGEKFEDLGPSHDEPGQGHFHNTDKVDKWYEQGGFQSYKDYLKAYNA